MALLDKIFITTCWENLSPNVGVKTLPRLGTDHTPLVFIWLPCLSPLSINSGLRSGGSRKRGLRSWFIKSGTLLVILSKLLTDISLRFVGVQILRPTNLG
jgi:hypothetical protein